MTIKEIESLTGLPRANIRYYEGQGFLSPLRSENGYRDYSQQDADTLFKIKLLRQLGFSLEMIQAIQQGRQPLSEAMLQREQELQREQALLGHAARMCHTLSEEGVTYETLDAQLYLRQMAQGEKLLNLDSLPYAFCPVRRYVARLIDWRLYSYLTNALIVLVLGVHYSGNPDFILPYLSDNPIVLGFVFPLLLMLTLEPLCLRLFSATPGKVLMGLQLRGSGGRPLTLAQGLRRTGHVLVMGVFFHIPVLSLLPLWQSFRRCDHEQFQPWDLEEDGTPLDYLSVTPRFRAVLAALAILPICYYLPGLCDYIAQAPPNRGEITAGEFAENVNSILTYEHGEIPLHLYVREDGVWVRENRSRFFFPYTSYEFHIDENGTLEGVGFSVRLTMRDEIEHYANQMRLTALAFLGAQPGQHPRKLERSGLIDAITQAKYQDLHLEQDGFTIRYRFDYSGYRADPQTGELTRIPSDPDPWYSMEFFITRTGS